MMIRAVAVAVAVAVAMTILYADTRRTIATENCQEQVIHEIHVF